MPALAAVREALRTRPEDLLNQKLWGQRQLMADAERYRKKREKRAMLGDLARGGAAHEYRMSELVAGGDIARDAAEAGREFQREQGETAFGRQKELLGLGSGLQEDAAKSAFERSLRGIREKHRLGTEAATQAAGLEREHDVRMQGLRGDLARDLQYAREGAADSAMMSELAESEKDRALRRDLQEQRIRSGAKESANERAFRETLARRKAETALSPEQKSYQTEIGKAAAAFGVSPAHLAEFMKAPPEEQRFYMEKDPRWIRVAQHYGLR